MVEHLPYKQVVIGSSPFALISINILYSLSAQLNGRVTVSKTVGMGSTPFALVNYTVYQFVWPKGYDLSLCPLRGEQWWRARTTQAE